MSSGLVPDRQFDFSGGIVERNSRFKQRINGLFSGVDLWATDDGIEPLEAYSTVSGGTITGGYGMVIAEPFQKRIRLFWINSAGNGNYRAFNESGAVTVATTLSLGITRQVTSGWVTTGGTSYALTLTDHASGGVFWQNGTATGPTGHRLAIRHRDYAFLMGKNTNLVEFTMQGNYTTFPIASNFNAPILGGIESAFSLKGLLFMFSPYETAVLTGRGPGMAITGGLSDFSPSIISTTYGCPWNETIQEIEGRLWFLSNKGPVVFDGSSFEPIGESLDLYDQYWDYGGSRYDYMCGSYYDHDRNLYYLSMPKLASGVGTITQIPKVYIFNTKTGKVVISAELANGSNEHARQAFAIARSCLSDKKSNTWAIKQHLSNNTPANQKLSVCVNRISSANAPGVSGTTIKTRFFFWGNPELPKWPSQIDLFGMNGSSFNTASIVSENQSVNIGSVSIGATGMKTMPIPSTLNGGGRFYGLNLTSGQKDFRLEGVVAWAHVGEKPRR